MLDCGFRVSETVTLRYVDFGFKKGTVTIKSPKKKRTLPLSDRLYHTLAQYIQKKHLPTAKTFYSQARNPKHTSLEKRLTEFVIPSKPATQS